MDKENSALEYLLLQIMHDFMKLLTKATSLLRAMLISQST